MTCLFYYRSETFNILKKHKLENCSIYKKKENILDNHEIFVII